MRKVAGFTIIELVVVITILGILAAVALPRFFEMQDDARRATVSGVAGAVASGAAVNYGASLVQGLTAAGPTAVAACTTAALGLVLAGGVAAWPVGVTVADLTGSALSAGVADGAVGSCVFAHAQGSGTFTNVTASIIKVD